MSVARETAEVPPPRFSLVCAVYGVERYLAEFFAGLDAQTVDHRQVEVVLVDDGSTDGSLATMRAWAATTDLAVTVLTQANGGQASARNLGLDHARGSWVGFPDPDDVLAPDYLQEVTTALERHPDASMVACALWMRREEQGVVEDTHPLRYRFEGGTTLRDLAEEPAYFFVSAPAGFYRRDRLEDLGLRFDERLRPNFEDGHLGGRYLLSLGRPTVLYVPGARYEYRKRGDGSSTLQTSLADPRRFTDVFRHGYLDLLRRATTAGGEVPGWLSHLLLYELGWLLRPQVRALTDSDPGLLAAAEEFHDLMAAIAPQLDTEAATRFALPRFTQVWRQVVRHGWSGESWHSPAVRVVRHDRDQGLVCLAYHHRGPRPEETFLVDGEVVAPRYDTVKPFSMMGRDLLEERFCWVPLGEGLRVRLGGRDVPLAASPGAPVEVLTGSAIAPERRVGARPAYAAGDRRRRVARVADSWPVRRRFADAWVLMDKVHDADDNAERLFEHLREHRPDLNAWFVVEEGTASWTRLRARFGRRVVAYGSRRWQLLLLNARHVVSSHADPAVMRPSALVRPGEPVPWRFTFLQHGVIKDDLSTWLNPKSLDLFVTSTRAEHESVVGERTNYVFTEREVVLTGLPRFDRLLRVGAEVSPADRDLLLVCPTWRSWLAAPMVGDSQRREHVDHFADSDFVRSWLGLLASPELAAAARAHDLRVAFLPHPNLQAALAGTPLPDHVEPLGFEGTDVQELIARCALMVTDYSSMAFNAAYLDRPVVYYQFDRDRMLGGDHVGTGGYFDYERDGFGPVAGVLADAVAAVVEQLDGAAAHAPYAARVRSTFEVRDGRCCERIVAAIEASTAPPGAAGHVGRAAP